METTLNKAADLITSFIVADIPVNLIGSPGVGKSDIIKQVADKLNLKVIDFRLSTADPTDLTGLPFVEDGRSVFLPNVAFPIEKDVVPEGYKGWLLFLDEISNAPMAVQAAAYKLILDREVGLHNLHPEVKIVSAGNKMTDGAAVTGEMSTALKSRMAHINIIHSLEVWLDWAMAAGVHHSITSYLKFSIKDFYRFDPKDKADTFPCPRTWAMADKLVQSLGTNSPLLRDALSATISDGVATNYINFCKNFANLPTFADIVKDPENAEVPRELSSCFAISGSIGSQTDITTVDQIMKYLDRMPMEFQLCTFNDFVKRNPGLAANTSVRGWLRKNAPHLTSD